MINIEGFKLYSDVMLKYWDSVQKADTFKFKVDSTDYTLQKSRGMNTDCIHLYVGGDTSNGSILSIYKGRRKYDPDNMQSIINLQWTAFYQILPSISDGNFNTDSINVYDSSNEIYKEEDEFNFHLDLMYSDNLFKETAKIYGYLKRTNSPLYCVEFRPRILNFHEVDLVKIVKSLSTTPMFWKCV